MIGTTLTEIRERIEQLASDDGEYYVVCARTGDRPVPVSGKLFEQRATARRALRAVEQYRSTLRRYDPRLPQYDLIVCERTGPTTTPEPPLGDGRRRKVPGPALETSFSGSDRDEPAEFAHRVAGAVFETLSEAGYDDVETAIMDAYFELAESVSDPDERCLCLLESTAREVDTRLDPAQQRRILADAATRLEPVVPPENPLSVTLTSLEDRGLIGGYTRSPWSVGFEDGARSVVVRLLDYALTPQRGRLPVVPIALELHRRQPEHPPISIDVAERDGGWRLTVVCADVVEPRGLASAPIESRT